MMSYYLYRSMSCQNRFGLNSSSHSLFRGFMTKSLSLNFVAVPRSLILMDPGGIVSSSGDGSHTVFPDALAFKNIKKQINGTCSTVCVKQDDPCQTLRVLYESLIAGGLAGVIVEAALYPIDTIKTRVQVARDGGKIIWKGLYSGLGGNLAGVLPASALFFGVYEPTKQKLLKVLPEKFSAVAHLAAGALGGAVSSIVRVPTEVVKQRMQTGQFSSASDAVRLIIAKEGFGGMYAGFGSFLLRDLPFDALQLCVYEQIRIGYKLAARRDLNDPENAMLGAFAGAVAGVLTTPLDVIKTRLMVQGVGTQYKGVSDCIKTIIREEGSSALWKGMGPRVLWIGIGGSIFFGVLEKTKQILLERRSQKSHNA